MNCKLTWDVKESMRITKGINQWMGVI